MLVLVSLSPSAVPVVAGTLNLLMAFFYVVASIASLLCFFMLFTNFDVHTPPHPCASAL